MHRVYGVIYVDHNGLIFEVFSSTLTPLATLLRAPSTGELEQDLRDVFSAASSVTEYWALDGLSLVVEGRVSPDHQRITHCVQPQWQDGPEAPFIARRVAAQFGDCRVVVSSIAEVIARTNCDLGAAYDLTTALNLHWNGEQLIATWTKGRHPNAIEVRSLPPFAEDGNRQAVLQHTSWSTPSSATTACAVLTGAIISHLESHPAEGVILSGPSLPNEAWLTEMVQRQLREFLGGSAPVVRFSGFITGTPVSGAVEQLRVIDS